MFDHVSRCLTGPSLVPLLLAGLLSGCGGPFIDSPFGTQTRNQWSDRNQEALETLADQGGMKSGQIRIGLLSDSHQNYSDLEKVVSALNEERLDFVIHLGDFTNIGSNTEFDAFIREISNLRHPLLVVLGNHDSVGAGPDLYRRIFGPFNFTLDYGGRRFLFYNSNSLEFIHRDGYSPAWLEEQLKDQSKPTYLFQHVNHDNLTHFSSADIQWAETLYGSSPQLRFVFNGHLHSGSYHQKGGMHFATIPRVEAVRYAILEIDDQGERLFFCQGRFCAEEAFAPHATSGVAMAP